MTCSNDDTLAPGATVAISSSSLEFTETAITDDDGHYYVEVPASSFGVTFYFGDHVDRHRADVNVGHATRVDASFPCD